MFKLIIAAEAQLLRAYYLRANFRCNATDSSNTKQLAVQGTENEHRMRVRRVRVYDAPRVQDFVRAHARLAWPYLSPAAHTAPGLIIITDFVARILSQGHSMVAEQFEPRRGWEGVRGVSLNSVVSAWDARLVERWARCIQCPQTRQFLNFTAKCLREPALFEKYKVKTILQMNLIVPPNTVRGDEVAKILAKNSIQRGSDLGYPRLRLDIHTDEMANSLKELNLKKECQLKYNETKDACTAEGAASTPPQTQNTPQKVVAVYTTSPVLKVEAVK